MSAVAWPIGPAPVNLLPASRRVALARRRRQRTWVLVLGAYFVALLGVWAWCGLKGRIPAPTGPAESAPGSATERLVAVNAEIERVQTERNKARAEITAANRKIDAAKAVGHHADWSVLLKLLAAQGGPPNSVVALERVELKPSPAPAADNAAKAKPATPTPAQDEVPDPWGYTLTIDGLAESQVEAVLYAKRLEGLQLFESVAIVGTHPRDSTAPDSNGLHLVVFQISCTLTNAAAAAHAAPAAQKQPAGGGGAP